MARWIAIYVVIFLLGLCLTKVSVEKVTSSKLLTGFSTRFGTICEGKISENRSSGTKQKFIVEKLRCLKKERLFPVSASVFLTLREHPWFFRPHIKEGDIVRFRAYFKKPRDFKNFNPPQFERYSLSKGIVAVGYVAAPQWIVKIGEQKSFLSDVVKKWRMSVESAALRALGDTDEFQLVKAIVLGDGRGLREELVDNFRNLGVIHLIVVSGFNVTILAGISWCFVVLVGSLAGVVCGQRDLRRVASLGSIVLIWVYIALTDFGVPAVRAGIIASVYFSSIVFFRNYDLWDSVALSAIFMLLLNPLEIYDISFQLTYAAIIGMIIFSKFLLGIKDGAGRVKNLVRRMVDLCIVSLGASLGVFPLLAYHFGKIPGAGPFLSILLSPIITFIVPFSLVAALITPLSPVAGSYLLGLLELPASLFLRVCGALAVRLQWSFFSAGAGFGEILVFYWTLILVVYWKIIKYRKTSVAIMLIVAGAVFFMTQPFTIHEGELAVAFLDVGQGAAVAVRLPDGRVTMIDGGGVAGSNFDLGRTILEPFLLKIGAEKVDRVIVTHPHPDHFKGLQYIIENFKPPICTIGDYNEEGLDGESAADWGLFLGAVQQSGIQLEKIRSAVWEDDGVTFSIYHMPHTLPPDWTINDSSLVIKIKYGEVSFLITGDIEAAAERYLADSEYDLESTVLQVPHHGSSTSSSDAFLDRVLPKYSVIQVGASNKFGFPQEDVLQRLEVRGIKTFRTDTGGAQMFVTNGQELKIFSAVNSK